MDFNVCSSKDNNFLEDDFNARCTPNTHQSELQLELAECAVNDDLSLYQH